MVHLVFKGLCDFPRGTVISLLSRSYADLALRESALLREWQRGWEQYDDDIHRHPDTVGRCGFVSSLAETVIGFGSWDPRSFPTAQIGHNCIIPEFRGRGYGAQQMSHTTALLHTYGFTRAVARTGNIAFFEPARRVYQRCGFVAAGTLPAAPGIPFGITEYELVL